MKFSLAMALSHHPDFIIMDEPTAGLDPIIRRELLDMMQDLIQDEEKAIFFSTHITTDLDKIADFIVFIHDGRIIFQGEKEEFTERYRLVKGTADQHSLLDGLPVIGLRATDVGFDCLVDTVEIPVDTLSSLLIEQPTLEDIMYYTEGANLDECANKKGFIYTKGECLFHYSLVVHHIHKLFYGRSTCTPCLTSDLRRVFPCHFN